MSMQKIFLGVAFLAVVISTAFCADNVRTQSARDLLHKMAQVYASCNSYRDTGTVTIDTQESKQASIRTVVRFQTAFVRPGRFRFKFSRKTTDLPRDLNAIWTSGGPVYASFGFESKVKTMRSLPEAIAQATGISGGAAQAVSSMLMPKKSVGWKLSSAKHPKIVAVESVDGVECTQIEGKDPTGTVIKLWVQRKNGLLRKMLSARDVMSGRKRFHIVSTTTYRPELNVSIPTREFSGVSGTGRKRGSDKK